MYWKKVKGSYGIVAKPYMEYCSSLAVKSAKVFVSSSLREEGQILDALRGSEYVVECFGEDVSIENGKHIYNLLFEYAAGGTLHDLIQNSKMMLQESEVANYAFHIVSGISEVHRKGFIHYDLKPANILVFPRRNGVRLKLANFELSARENETRRGHKGTLLYASPESVAYGIHGKAGDIWALGCIVVEMITGRQLWSVCCSTDELEFKITREKPKIPNNISDEAKDFLGKCFERDHNWRWIADMLLNHPFIKSQKLLQDGRKNPFAHEGKTWVSMEHMFSTITPLPRFNNAQHKARPSTRDV